MIFKQIDEILGFRKAQTRRTVKDGEMMTRYSGWYAMVGPAKRESDRFTQLAPEPAVPAPELVTVRTSGGRLKWGVGNTYAIVPKRGAPAIKDARIQITHICCQHLQDISEHDALAEGVNNVEEYRKLWEEINGAGSWDKNPLVWVLTFQLVNM